MRAPAAWFWLLPVLVSGAVQSAGAQEVHDHHAGHAMPAEPERGAPADAPGAAVPPPAASDHAADAYFPAARMAASREELIREDRFSYAQILVDRFEWRSGNGRDGYAWQGEASSGTDRDRLVLASEGEGTFGKRPEQAEFQAKWRHAVDPWFNVEAGVRHDLEPGPQRTYLLLGVEGLAPYWIETEAQVFVSNRGDIHARLQAEHDERITQRLVLRPEVEVNLALQDVPELGITSRLPEWAIGARLRYEITPRLGPYLGVEQRRSHADPRGSQAVARADRSSTNLVLGLRTWF